MANFAFFKMSWIEAVTISSVVEKGFFQDASVGRLVASKPEVRGSNPIIAKFIY